MTAFLQDPIDLVDRLLPPEDQEIVAFVVAGLSYGRVEQILQSCSKLFSRLETVGLEPEARGIRNLCVQVAKSTAHKRAVAKALQGWCHRLSTEHDLLELFSVLGRLVEQHQSLLRAFVSASSERSLEIRLSEFSKNCLLLKSTSQKHSNKDRALSLAQAEWRGTGVEWFFSSPKNGSTCKRMLMFLRWVVRTETPDLGLWSKKSPLAKGVRGAPQPCDLLSPVDTHVFRWGKERGVLTEKTPNWKSVLKVSAAMRSLNPHDPLAIDFAICHQGMTEFRGSQSP